MLVLKDVARLDGVKSDVELPGYEAQTIDASGLTLLPALIDPHVHFRVPGAEHKEDWRSGARAAIGGGVTTVFDMPNNTPNCSTLTAFIEKEKHIERQLDEVGLPLRHYLYVGAERRHLSEIPKLKGLAVGIKVFMGSSTGDLLIDDEATLSDVFKMAADLDMIVSVHAEDEHIINANKSTYGGVDDPSYHSIIRSREAAVRSVERAISLAAKYKNKLCILHVGTKEETQLIRQAKKEGIAVFGETSPHHLLLSTKDYAAWGNLVKVNPPLRDIEDQDALWRALHEGTLDFIGTDHAPHTLSEKQQSYGKAPAGIPSIDLLLPLLLQAVQDKKMTLAQLVRYTRIRIEEIFGLPRNEDYVLVDLGLRQQVTDEQLSTKAGWSPYKGRILTGWPVYTLFKGAVYARGPVFCKR